MKVVNTGASGFFSGGLFQYELRLGPLGIFKNGALVGIFQYKMRFWSLGILSLKNFSGDFPI